MNYTIGIFNKVVFLLLCFSISLTLEAQIQVDNTLFPEDLVAIIVGDGINYSNVIFTGDMNQFGGFNENGGGLGINQGIILGTGDVELAEGPNDDDGATLGGGGFDVNTDPDLEIIAGVGINDVAILEFDFVPMGNDVTFHYVFGSEEYNEYVCADFNDAFGFFLSGPGISGSFSSPAGFPNGSVNLALIPGGNIGVSIGTVNNGSVGDYGEEFYCSNLDPNWQSNTMYFVDNTNSTMIQYDGMTVVMEASYNVQCGETYHIKLAIGDGVDSSLDSGVFIEENSFSSAVPVTVDLQIDQETDIENGIYEGCGGATLEFIRDGGDLSNELTIDLNYSGDAENGVDYDLPSSITFAPNESTFQLAFDPFADGIAEPVENVQISMSFTDGCLTQDEIDLVEVFIVDVEPLSLSTNDESICGDESVELIPEVSGGIEPITYLWSNNETTSTITVDGNGPTQYTVTVSDGCDETEDLEGVFNLIVGTGPEISYPPGTIDIVCEESVEVECVIVGAYNQITFSTDGGDVIGNTNPLIYNTSIGASSLTVAIVDDCGAEAEITIPINYITPSPLQVDLGEDIFASCIDQNFLEATISGGGEPYQFSWTIDGIEVSNQPTYSFNTHETIQVDVQVTDGCDQIATDEITVHIPDNPLSIEVSDDLLVCPRTEVVVSALATGGEDGFTYQWSNLGFGQTQTFTPTQSNDYTVTATDICGESISESVTIDVIPFDVEYTLEEVVENEYYFESITFPECNGECNYFWDFGDNTSSIGETTNHVYDGLGVYHGYVSAINEQGCIDTANFTIFPPLTVYVPNTFSPNNDGINDVFRAFGIGVTAFHIQIFNRWGIVIYESDDINEVWAGEVSEKYYYSQNEQYNYIIVAKGYDAETYTKRGVLTVIR